MTQITEEPPKKKRRYFFGWHLVNGIAFALMWMEDEGLVVGGIPNVVGSTLEITEEEFNTALLADLAKQLPFEGVQGVSYECLPDKDDTT